MITSPRIEASRVVEEVSSFPPYVPATLWRRTAARFVDAFVVFFTIWALAVLGVLWFVGPLSDAITPRPWDAAFVPTVLFVSALGVYEVIFLAGNHGQTPGKDLLRIRVVRRCADPRDEQSGELGIARSALRAALPVLAWVVHPFWLGATVVLSLGLTAFVGGRHGPRAIHDHLGGTTVIRDERTTSQKGQGA